MRTRCRCACSERSTSWWTVSPPTRPASDTRGLLALLALEANTVVPVDSLVARMWGEDPPPSAVNVVQTYVSAWRKVLDPAGRTSPDGRRLETVGSGYRLRLATDECDVLVLRDLLSRGRTSRPRRPRAGRLPPSTRRLVSGAARRWPTSRACLPRPGDKGPGGRPAVRRGRASRRGLALGRRLRRGRGDARCRSGGRSVARVPGRAADVGPHRAKAGRGTRRLDADVAAPPLQGRARCRPRSGAGQIHRPGCSPGARPCSPAGRPPRSRAASPTIGEGAGRRTASRERADSFVGRRPTTWSGGSAPASHRLVTSPGLVAPASPGWPPRSSNTGRGRRSGVVRRARRAARQRPGPATIAVALDVIRRPGDRPLRDPLTALGDPTGSWCWTTSSTCRRPPGGRRPAPQHPDGCGSCPRRASRCGLAGEQQYPVPLPAVPPSGPPASAPRWSRSTRCGCWSTGRAPTCRTSLAPRRTLPTGPPSPAGWTACRSPSRSSPPGCGAHPADLAATADRAARHARSPGGRARAAPDAAGHDRLELRHAAGEERALLCRLAVFAGGFTVSAVEGVCGTARTMAVTSRRACSTWWTATWSRSVRRPWTSPVPAAADRA